MTYDRGEAPWSISYHFMPDELRGILEKNGVKNVELAGPGAFARTIPNEILVKIVNDPVQRMQFLEFCHMYDSNPYVCGMGKDNVADLSFYGQFKNARALCEHFGLDYSIKQRSISNVCRRVRKTFMGKYILRYPIDDEFAKDK